MLVMNRAGIESMLKSKFTLGGDASVAAGPVGRATSAETDAAMKAKILSYSRSRGAFAGVSLTGTTLHTDEDANKAVYGKPVEAAEILHEKTPVPAAAKPLVSVLSEVLTEGCVGACAVRTFVHAEDGSRDSSVRRGSSCSTCKWQDAFEALDAILDADDAFRDDQSTSCARPDRRVTK